MSTTSLGYRPDIDGMRAIAVGLVVIFHFHLFPIGEAGFIGVDIFFVLSGFLITRIILSGLGAGDFRLPQFYLARIRRLYPALLVVLAGYLAAAYFLFLPDIFRELSIEAALSQLYVINIYFWRTVNYFGLQAKEIPLLHMWSLAVEEQFYIFYPVFLIALHRFARPILLPVLALVVLASFLLGVFASGWKPQAAFYLLPTRAWELGVGGLLAAWQMRAHTPALLAKIAGPAGLALIAIALYTHIPGTPFPGWFAALPVFGTVGLILAGSGHVTMVSRLLSLSPMVWVGRISYPLYLVHWPVIICLNQSLPEVGWSWRAGGLLLSVILSFLILKFVETPIRSKRVWPGAASFLGFAGSSTAGLILICVIGAQSGLSGRFDPQVSQILDFSQDRDHRLENCDWPAEPCPIGAAGATQVALIGDSHAQALAEAFSSYLQQTGQSGALFFGSSCLPVSGLGSPRCAEFTEATLSRIEESPTIDTVVFSSIWRQPYEGAGIRAGQAFLSGADAHDAFAEALENTVRRLRQAGKNVVLIEPLYAAPGPVPRTMARNLAFGTNWPIDLPVAEHRAQFSRAYDAFARAQRAGATRVSLIEELCANGTCPGTLAGAPVFFDNNHIRFGMAAYFARVLMRVMPSS